MPVLQDDGHRQATEPARIEQRLTMLMTAGITGSSLVASWLLLGTIRNGRSSLVSLVGWFILALLLAGAGWFGIGLSYSNSNAVARQVARHGLIAHGVWFAVAVLFLVEMLMAVGATLSAGPFGLGPLFSALMLATLVGGTVAAFMVTMRRAGKMAALCYRLRHPG